MDTVCVMFGEGMYTAWGVCGDGWGVFVEWLGNVLIMFDNVCMGGLIMCGEWLENDWARLANVWLMVVGFMDNVLIMVGECFEVVGERVGECLDDACRQLGYLLGKVCIVLRGWLEGA